MYRLFKILIVGIIYFSIIGCSGTTPEGSPNMPEQFPHDKSGIKIESEQASPKRENLPLIEVYWKLIWVNGNAVISEKGEREAYIILKLDNNRLQGFGGCNIIIGAYELKDEEKLSFSNIASTRMACPRMPDESSFLKELSKVDNYTIIENVLMLNKADMSTLATFEAVYQP